MALTLVTAPVAEPVGVGEFKSFASIDTNAHDQVLASMIKDARMVCESILKRALITQTWDYTLDEFSDEIRIPLPPLVSITHVQYVDTNGSLQTLAPTVYEVDTNRVPTRVRLAYSKSWPGIRYVYNPVTIRYVAGYGPKASDVPDPIRSWIKQRVATQYVNREGVVTGITVTPLPREYVDGLLDEYRVYQFG